MSCVRIPGVDRTGSGLGKPFEKGYRGHASRSRRHRADGASPSGRVGWSSLQKRFDANAAKLYEKHAALREHDNTFRTMPRKYELYETSDGDLQLASRERDGARRWVLDLCNIQQLLEQARLGHDPEALFCGAYVVLGDRFGLLFKRAYEGTKKMFLTFTPRIYLVEPDPIQFGVTLFVSQSIDAYCDDRVLLFVGSDAIERFLTFFEEHPKRSVPEHILTGCGSSWDPFEHTFETVRLLGEARAQKAVDNLAVACGHYDSLPATHWRRRLESSEPPRILGLTSRFTTYLQYSMRDCRSAFERLGHHFETRIEENDHDLPSSHVNAAAVADLKPDL
ncbi:MAG: hypothetical protein JSU63_08260 [Phycisphaerales bacterium]|nr:MAG: hypothetical protein JSU63_08260 [Phycisphaerales bacterium]